MTTINSNLFRYSALSLAISSIYLPASSVSAQQIDKQIEKIEITATRRSGSVQEAPLNITALTGDVLKDQNIGELEDVARWVPGLTVTDQGGRNDSPIIVRGLNTNSSGPGSNGQTVATYVGEIPLFINMRLNDIQRVEVLIGPQGTLYGAGTLGGAIRYIPNKVDLDLTEGQVYGDLFSTAESSSIGGEGGFVFNTPLINDELGLRLSLNKFHSPGYVDYNYVVQNGGVSLPDPDWSNQSDVDANIRRVEDANGEDTLTGKASLRWQPTDWFDATLNYFYQKQDVEGRNLVHYQSLAESNTLSPLVGKYESAYRYEEPREKEDSLLSLEITADLGFAELVSATGKSKFEAVGQRDQTDLLIRLAYSYEEFPSFAAFTREDDNADIFTQEIRLVSKSDSAFSWIAGVFYNKIETYAESREFTPGFDEYAINVWGVDGNFRPDSLEYYSVDQSDVTESAIFGELSYAIDEDWDVTVGLRQYNYDISAQSAFDLPLFNSVFLGADPDAIFLDFTQVEDDDSGSLFKFNTSYRFSSTIMGYLTVSEGFRIGGVNPVAACPEDVNDEFQSVCTLPDEQLYTADTTTNYELGFKSTWLKNKFHFNASVFNVDWENPQVTTVTTFGGVDIQKNASEANSKGLEISTRAILSDSLTAYATYSFTKAEITKNEIGLFKKFDPTDGNDAALIAKYGQEIIDFYSVLDGDRLPGTAENQLSLGLKYSTEIFDNALLDIVYGLTAQSDVYTKIGLRADGEAIPGYALSNFAATISEDDWAVTLYIDNLFNKYAFSSVRREQPDIGLARFEELNSNRTDLQRNYGHYLLEPRTIGIKFTYNFEI